MIYVYHAHPPASALIPSSLQHGGTIHCYSFAVLMVEPRVLWILDKHSANSVPSPALRILMCHIYVLFVPEGRM